MIKTNQSRAQVHVSLQEGGCSVQISCSLALELVKLCLDALHFDIGRRCCGLWCRCVRVCMYGWVRGCVSGNCVRTSAFVFFAFAAASSAA